MTQDSHRQHHLSITTPVRPARRCPRTGLSPSPRGSRGHVDRVSGPHAHDPQRGSTEVFPDRPLPAVHLPCPAWVSCGGAARGWASRGRAAGSACCSSRSRGTLGTAGPALPSARGRPHRPPSHCPGAESGAETTHRAPSCLGAGPSGCPTIRDGTRVPEETHSPLSREAAPFHGQRPRTAPGRPCRTQPAGGAAIDVSFVGKNFKKCVSHKY